jgi:hypothetical protein
MDEETRTFLRGMEERLRSRMEKGEANLEERVLARIEKAETNLEKRLLAHIEKSETNLEERLLVRIEKSETNLLRAFHGWGRGLEIRQRNATGAITGFDERLTLIEERVAELERGKLN